MKWTNQKSAGKSNILCIVTLLSGEMDIVVMFPTKGHWKGRARDVTPPPLILPVHSRVSGHPCIGVTSLPGGRLKVV